MSGDKSSFLHAISGALGSAISITCLFPLETARTRLQVFSSTYKESFVQLIVSIYRNEGGLRALYRGWYSTVLSLFLTNFVYFYIFNASRRLIQKTVHGDFLCGVLAGIVAVVITNPIWVINTRLKLQGVKASSSQDKKNDQNPAKNKKSINHKKYQGTLDCAYQIWMEEHITAFWAGTSSSLLLVANPAIQFSCYEALKLYTFDFFSKYDLQVGAMSISPSFLHFVNGAVSKFLATVITYPLQVLQTRTRAGCHCEKIEGKNILKQIIFLARQDGSSSLFKGLTSKLTQTCLNAAIMFLIYERIVSFLSYIQL